MRKKHRRRKRSAFNWLKLMRGTASRIYEKVETALSKPLKKEEEWQDKYGGKVNWDVLRKAVLERDGHRCVVCKTDKNLRVHHLIPKSQGGRDEPQNLITLCKDCHQYVHPENPRIW